MITFSIAVLVLLLGYFFYSRLVERIFIIDPGKATPAVSMADGVDYVVMPGWKIFLIQFLNIAGLGPIFGAVAGAMWGPVAFLWIALGSVLAGGVHDYFSGMLCLRHNGKSIAEVAGYYLGGGVRQFMRAFTVVLLIMVGAVFLIGPARILGNMTAEFAGFTFWIWAIFLYYILSTVLPIDKLIGKIYPVFGFALLFMAVGILVMMVWKGLTVPELTIASLSNQHSSPQSFPVFPMLFITIACGAISGFHATQSPLMARCMSNERQGRSIFYGTMVTEGVVAMIWAAISMSFFGGIAELNGVMTANGGNAAVVVNEICSSLLGPVGGILALLGVVAAPITSGDTAFRGARLIVADFLKMDQGPLKSRLLITIPLFLCGYLLTLVDFGVVWRYFAWTNQTLATIVLWTITVWLIREGKAYWIALAPAVFMTSVVISYILLAPEGFGLPAALSQMIGAGAALLLLLLTMGYIRRSALPQSAAPQ
ncbi:carbon starvation protein CstA [Anseongella ginsenosidimutans]|uniref:Carbon starvation protein CstA n=1 Tax=Anseongella ginsenosidimutans TaxID=496056 RepID=A0A4R3KNJ3_9SPHI|nr:carbon starvation protein A [Anseongella ginsenosidimutans]QEC52503.1 carbon starvation protein A [Anseongella ginsenosidimutans]TCS85316.1 carbon starvation protein CstA [Anseongella ginsenosidimutans]